MSSSKPNDKEQNRKGDCFRPRTRPGVGLEPQSVRTLDLTIQVYYSVDKSRWVICRCLPDSDGSIASISMPLGASEGASFKPPEDGLARCHRPGGARWLGKELEAPLSRRGGDATQSKRSDVDGTSGG